MRGPVSAEDFAQLCEQHITALAGILADLALKPQGSVDDLHYATRLRAIVDKVAPKLGVIKRAVDECAKHIPLIKARRDDVTSHLLKDTPRAVIAPVAPPSGTMRPICIVPGYFIEAVPIQSFSQVMRDGRLYYMESRDLFAAYLNGVRYCGNIGEVVRMKQPERVTKCQREDCNGIFANGQPCRFYHPQRQTRNWKEMHMRYSLDHTERLLGSRSQIPEDVPRVVADGDADMYMELAFHYFLLSLVLSYHVRNTGS